MSSDPGFLPGQFAGLTVSEQIGGVSLIPR